MNESLLMVGCFLKLLGCPIIAMPIESHILSLCLPAVISLSENEKIKKGFSRLGLSDKSHSWTDLLAAVVV